MANDRVDLIEEIILAVKYVDYMYDSNIYIFTIVH
jgi:hypothetical protein